MILCTVNFQKGQTEGQIHKPIRWPESFPTKCPRRPGGAALAPTGEPEARSHGNLRWDLTTGGARVDGPDLGSRRWHINGEEEEN